MLIPKIIAALLVARQLDTALPTTYCTPECPSCKSEYTSFNSSTACVANSTFITDCSICQQCILTYNINIGQTPDAEKLENEMVDVLNLCENSTVSRRIQDLQSDASRISAALVASTTMPPSTVTAAPTITSAPYTHTRNGSDWESRCTTASWCSYISARRSASSAAVASSLSAILANATATAASSHHPEDKHPSPLNLSWIIGPIVGTVLGFVTVFVVIYFTRRRNANLPVPAAPPPQTPSDGKDKEFNDASSTVSTPVAEKAQLHSECVEPKELETTEIVELPAREPVGNELLSPRSGNKADSEEDEDEWPLPISPLPALFAATEIRDQRLGLEKGVGLRHETFYHP